MAKRERIVAMLRVKNEARWITEVLDALRPISFKTVVFDDHSTDETPLLAGKAGAQVIPSPQSFEGVDEVRDKNFLFESVRRDLRPDWVLCVDGDEVLRGSDAIKIVDIVSAAQHRAYSLKIEYLWDRTDQVRTDGIYGRFFRPSLFNAQRTDGRFASYYGSGQKAGFHCSNVPWDLVIEAQQVPIRLKHYGYLERDQRIAKYHWYNSIDPANAAEDRYRHIVQGDVPEVPADQKLLHAGPLQLAAWP